MAKNIIRKMILFASTLALLLFAEPFSNVLAENVYPPVSGGNVNVEKYLIYGSGENCPEVTFTYTITPGTAKPGTQKKEAIISGGDSSVDGTPTIGEAVFTAKSKKYTSSQKTDTNTGIHPNLEYDPVNLTDKDAYSRTEVPVDFTGVTFHKPGVFRWVVTEVSSSDTDLKVDENNVRYLDVYVANISPNQIDSMLRVNGYVLHSVESYQPSTDGSHEEAEQTKGIGFITDYQPRSSALYIFEDTKGNQSNHDRYFHYKVDITDGGKNRELVVTGDFTEMVPDTAPTTAILYAVKAKINTKTITTDANGKASVDFYLKDDQYVKISGLAHGYDVKVSVVNGDYKTNGYYALVPNEKESLIPTVGDSSEYSAKFDGTTILVENVNDALGIFFTNTRQGAIPTGVLNTVLPSIVMMTGSLILIAYVLEEKNRKRGECE